MKPTVSERRILDSLAGVFELWNQGGKELVFSKNTAICQGIYKRRFTSISIAHQGYSSHLISTFSLSGTLLIEFSNFDFSNPIRLLIITIGFYLFHRVLWFRCLHFDV